MAVGTTRSVARSLLSALQSPELNEMPSVFGYRSQLEDLQATVKTIIGVLRVLQAQEDEELSHQAKKWMEVFKAAVFEADDLFDELVTLAKQNQLLCPSQKVINFFCPSKNHPFIVGERMSRGIRIAKKKLADLASEGRFFNFDALRSGRMRREESCAFVSEREIIGRQEDLETIISKLLASDTNTTNDQRDDLSVLSIVGIGGVGKTALAQLVYNHPKVKSAFPLRLWTCVSDLGQEELDVKDIVLKILASFPTHSNADQGPTTMGQLQTAPLGAQLAGQKYLLVLDDVWTEDPDHWSELVSYLTGGARGSCILVTTRSRETAAITGGLKLELSGLSEEHSWRLFQRAAFASEEWNPPVELVEIGKSIVRESAGLPLAIKVAGCLLYGRDTSQWLSVQKVGLGVTNDHIMPILKQSFHRLESPIRSCLCYFSLFPEDYVIEKEMLISLWMAQGYIVPLSKDQSLEDAAQEYVTILLDRCFLQDMEKDAYGVLISCKLQSTIHPLACHVAGTEMCLSNDHRLNHIHPRHLTFMGTLDVNHDIRSSQIRSLLHIGGWYKDTKMEQSELKALVKNCKCLRTLDLSNLGIESLPNSIGKLLHLRYLNLSRNRDLKLLPREIISLVNMQALILNGCDGLKELPEDLSKLTNLRVLDIKECSSLTCMPSGLSKLSSLHSLTEFVLGETSLKLNQWFDQLEDLKALLQTLTGHLTIHIESSKNAIYAKEDARREESNLSNKVHLNHIRFSFTVEEVDGEGGHEKLLGVLQPHANIKGLDFCGYDGVRMPGWITFLPNLVRLCLENCKKLQCLPYLRNMFHLKVFHLVNLLNMEYIFEYSNASASSINPAISAPTGSQSAAASLCPSLQKLHLINLPKLKGLFRPEVGLGVENEPMLVSNNSIALLQQSLFGHRELDSLIVKLRPEQESVSPGSGVEELSSWGAGTSSTKERIDPATAKTHESKAEVAAAPYTPPLSVDLQSQPASPFNDKAVNDALLYRSLFPSEYEFEKIALLQLWLADGIFDEEETAGIFFDKCVAKGHIEVSRSIFPTSEAMYFYTFKGDMVHTYIFTELLWQMYNRFVSKSNHAVKIEDTSILKDVSSRVSHLSVACRNQNNSSDLSQFERFGQLRALIFLQGHLSSLRQVPRDFFLSLKLLRTLDLSHTHLEELPSSIGNMKCLCYLNLTKTPIKHLPEELDCLENLQTLKLRGCSNLSALPKGMRKLVKLRYLDFDVLGQLRSMPEGMGALTNIRTLSAFIVGVEEGRSIRQLKNMNNLSGSFCISGLQNVLNKDQSIEATDLCYKLQLRKLELRWSDSKHKYDNGHTEVLSSLQPNADLEELYISCYGGSNWASWICSTLFNRLANITLFMCENCTALPSVGKLPALKSLNIVSFNKLRFIDRYFYKGSDIQGFIAFPKLERLTIQDMPSLEEWRDTEKSYFPQLSSLKVKQCPKLVRLCTLSSLHSLEVLETTHCEKLVSYLDEELPPSLETFISVECPLITENARTLKCNNHQKWLKLLEQIPNLWIDHRQMTSSISSEEEDESSEGDETEEGEGEAEEEEKNNNK